MNDDLQNDVGSGWVRGVAFALGSGGALVLIWVALTGAAPDPLAMAEVLAQPVVLLVAAAAGLAVSAVGTARPWSVGLPWLGILGALVPWIAGASIEVVAVHVEPGWAAQGRGSHQWVAGHLIRWSEGAMSAALGALLTAILLVGQGVAVQASHWSRGGSAIAPDPRARWAGTAAAALILVAAAPALVASTTGGMRIAGALACLGAVVVLLSSRSTSQPPGAKLALGLVVALSLCAAAHFVWQSSQAMSLRAHAGADPASARLTADVLRAQQQRHATLLPALWWAPVAFVGVAALASALLRDRSRARE